jgi:hypothetical protein
VAGEAPHQLEGVRAQEDIRRIPERRRCATHLPRSHHPPAARTRKHRQTVRSHQGQQRQGSLPSIRVHGNRPARSARVGNTLIQREDTARNAYSLHRLPALQSTQIPPLCTTHPPRLEEQQRPPQLRLRKYPLSYPVKICDFGLVRSLIREEDTEAVLS